MAETARSNAVGRWILLLLAALAALVLILWIARARLAAELARNYFSSHGVTSDIEIGSLSFSGFSGRFALGPTDAPELAAESIEVRFDPLSWRPRIVEVRLVKPVVRARMDAQGKVTLPALQAWLDSLSQTDEESPYVSKDLIVSLNGLRAMLQTPSGVVDASGTLRLEKNVPVSGALTLRPAKLSYQGQDIALQSASMNFSTVQAGMQGNVQFMGSMRGHSVMDNVNTQLTFSGLSWKNEGKALSVSVSSLRVLASAKSFQSNVRLANPQLDLQVQKISALLSGSDIDGQADVTLKAGSDVAAPHVTLPDAALNAAITRNLTHLDFAASGHIEQRARQIHFAAATPVTISSARGAALKVDGLRLAGPANALRGSFQATLSGGGLPNANLSVKNLALDSGGLDADITLASKFDFAMLRGADVKASGKASWRGEDIIFDATSCTPVALASFRPGNSNMAEKAQGQICPAGNQPLFTMNSEGWKFTATAQGASAFLPLANVDMDSVSADMSFDATENSTPRGRIQVKSGRISDHATSIRFKPMLGTGAVMLANNNWRGQFAVTSEKKETLGNVTFTHAMANSSGSAHITAEKLNFVPDKLQPEDISPLLAAFKQAKGPAHFEGDIRWTPQAITSSGMLSIDALDFMTPLGKAHTVKTHLDFISLLPPATAPNQKVAIALVDWTLPFSAIGLVLSFNPTVIRVDSVNTDFAGGSVTVSPFAVTVADPQHVEGTADVKGISLAQLVTASNLGSKVKLEGKVTGHIPFAVTPEGFRVTNGHIAADGPGRLSIDRSLWTQGAATTNSVQDFAYQALENLAFEQLSADLNSVANGRLQIVFHIKGKSDPPQPQTANIPISDLVDGSALQKPIPLPSGTPIDLTLDTSLNFDELLKSYGEAWSKALNSAE